MMIAARLIGLAFTLALVLPVTAHAHGEDGVEVIGVDEVRQLQSTPRRILIVDVRSADEFRERHIKDAVNVPLTEIERRVAEIPKQGLVVLY